VLLIALGVIAAVVGALLGVSLAQASAAASVASARPWIRFALVCTALLGLTLVVIFWLVVRFARTRIPQPPPPGRTEHVDAWRLAGERMKMEEERGEREE
jgi:hypothetical protein